MQIHGQSCIIWLCFNGVTYLTDDTLNFGVSTLEEIRLRKALKASMKRAGYPIQSTASLANGEKENIQSFFRPALNDAREGKKQELVLLRFSGS